jgi:hypothetical protein
MSKGLYKALTVAWYVAISFAVIVAAVAAGVLIEGGMF